jgi:5-methyltetrahydropteroyltriglutamate--homocysteine methyltransferase
VAGFDGVTFGLHVCRGNRPGHAPGQGSYAPVAEQLFSQVPHQRLLLEYDTERSGGFEVLRFVPKDKMVVIGVVSTKTAEVESVDEIRRRVEQAARYLPLEQLAISPQCGFASHVGGPPVPEEAQWRKLANLLEAARRIWGSY